jgi:integrase
MSTVTVTDVRNLVELDRSVRAYQAASQQPGTWTSYNLAWQRFVNFCAPKDAWKATAEDVARWCVWLAGQGRSVSTISGNLSGLKFYYEQLGKGYLKGRPGVATRPSPSSDELVRRVLRGIRRRHGRPTPRKAPLLLDSVEKMMDVQPDNMRGLRNRAFLSLTWAACRRVSEMYGLNVDRTGNGWIEFDQHGLVVVLRRSKTNQDFQVEERYGVPARLSAPRYCPVALIKEWMKQAELTRGPLFPSLKRNRQPRGRRICHNGLSHLVRTAAEEIGLDPTSVSPHSLRIGCITWLYLEGVHPERIREQSGHKDLQTLFDYIRPFKRSSSSPLAETRWVR